MKDEVRVMISGVGAVIGYGLARQLFGIPGRHLIGTDWSDGAIGKLWVDGFLKSPPVASDEYIPWLLSICSNQEVHVYLPGFEQEIRVLARHRGSLSGRATRFCLNSPDLIELAADKLQMSEFIRERFPQHWIRTESLPADFTSLTQRLGLPFIVKPRNGMAGRGFRRVATEPEFLAATGSSPEAMIAQEFVGKDDEEFTVAVFAVGEMSEAPTIVMRRLLSPEGSTKEAWRVDNEQMAELARDMCRVLRALGPTNLQFRNDENRTLLLEVNPRFSSSTSIRNLFGYAEAEMAIQFLMHGAVPRQPRLQGRHVVRYWEEHLA